MEVELSTDETVRALRVQTLLWTEVEAMKKIEQYGDEQYVCCSECGLTNSVNQLGLDAWRCFC